MSDNTASTVDTVAPGSRGLYNGFRLEFLKPGTFEPSFLDSKYANGAVSILNALMNGKIVKIPAPTNQDGTADPSAGIGRFVWSDTNVIIELYDSAAGGSGTGNMNYRGDYADDVTYNPGDVVRVKPTNPSATPTDPDGAIPGVYVNIKTSIGAGPGGPPKHPLQTGGENAYWNWLSTWPSPIASCDQNGNTTTEFADAQPSHT